MNSQSLYGDYRMVSVPIPRIETPAQTRKRARWERREERVRQRRESARGRDEEEV